MQIAGLLWREKLTIAKVFGVALVLAVIVSFILPKYYESTAILLPASSTTPALSSGTISSLASLAGINIGSSNPEEMYPDIVMSEAILHDVVLTEFPIDSTGATMNLIEYWKIDNDTPEENYEEALDDLRNELSAAVDKDTYIVTLKLMTKYPLFTANVLNAIVNQLDLFLRTKNKTTASEQRKWIESRLKEVEVDLAKSEDSLKVFREKNRRVEDSPKLMLEQDRLVRDTEINSTLYLELKKQLELTKIEEIKNVPIVNVMDEARPAAEKSRPKRMVIAVLGAFAGLFLGIGWVLVDHYYRTPVMEFLSIFRRKVREHTPSA